MKRPVVDAGVFEGQLDELGAVGLVVDGEVAVEPEASAYMRSRRAPRLWKVLIHTRLPGTRASMRWRISPAALLVKVMARMLPGRTPWCSS